MAEQSLPQSPDTEKNGSEEPSPEPESQKPAVPLPVINDPRLNLVLEQLKSIDPRQLNERLPDLINDGTTDFEPVQQVLSHAQAVAVLFDPPYEMNKARPGALQNRIKRVNALLDLPAILPGIDIARHAYIRDLEKHNQHLKDRLDKARQESADRVKATHRQFAALSAMIKDGKWGPANSMLRRLQKKLDAMEPPERSSLGDKLERAQKQLADMAEWQDFAARPKLEVLCEQMEALQTQELSPELLARQVREYQSAWKALGVSRASNELWPRFKKAGDAAYEPCKTYFAQKEQERQKKLTTKAALCTALESALPQLQAESPDWKGVMQMINRSKREWSQNRVPDRKPDKALETRFSQALKPFEQALIEQYDANAQLKRDLITKAQALAADEITQHSANQAKRLLSAWKLVGVMRRKEDQTLWEEFNGHLGTVFKHQHKVEREKQRAGLEHVYRARDIIKRLKTLAKADTVDEAEVQNLNTEFQGLADFPDRDRKFLLRDFRQALDACSKTQDHAARRRKQAVRDEIQRLLGLCEQLEHAVEHPGLDAETLVDDVRHAWEASDVRVPAEIAELLQLRRDAALEHLAAHTKPDYSANEELRRELLIRMEVAAGIETPAEDKSRRMQYQLQNLQQGMNSAGMDDARQTLKQLEKNWMAAGPVSTHVRDSLNSRYQKACQR